MKPRSIMLNHRQKSNLWNGTILNFWGRTVPSGGKIMITIFWGCEGAIFVDVMPRGRNCQQDADGSRKHFQWFQPHKNPVLFQHGNTSLQRSLKTQEPITKFGPIHSVASICHPQICTYLEPWRLQSAVLSLILMSMWFVSANWAAWAGQGMVLARQTHPCSLLAWGHRTGQSVCRKIGNGVKPSLCCSYYAIFVI